MNAADTAAALAERAEVACARYLPNGRKQGRYWTAGDVHGGKGRSLFVRLAPPGVPGLWTDAADGTHGDLLDLIRLTTGAASLREALAEARRFLAQPISPAGSNDESYDRTEAACNLWSRCRPIENTHAESYLHARAIRTGRFPALRFHPSLAYRHDTGRWSRFPALVAAVTDNGGDLVGVHRTWLDPSHPVKARVERPRKALGHVHGRAVRFSSPSQTACSTLLVGEGIETVLSLVTALPHAPLRGADLRGAARPETVAAAALSAGSLGAFVPPPGVSRLLIAQDRDAEGQRAALRLQRRCTRLGIGSAVIVPERNDFNDDLRELGTEHLAQRLTTLTIPHPASVRTAAPKREE